METRENKAHLAEKDPRDPSESPEHNTTRDLSDTPVPQEREAAPESLFVSTCP